jgi:hypothetical protein
MGLFIVVIFVDTIVHVQHLTRRTSCIIVNLYTQQSFKGFFSPDGLNNPGAYVFYCVFLQKYRTFIDIMGGIVAGLSGILLRTANFISLL